MQLGAHTIGIRHEHIAVSTTSGAGSWSGSVGVAEHLGIDTFIHMNAGPLGTLTVRASGEVPVNHGDTVFLPPGPNRIHRFNADGMAL